jgi:hypothetical protein
VADLDDLVVLVDEDDLGLELVGLLGSQLRVGDDDDEVTGADESSRRPVDAEHPGAPLTLDRIGREAVAVVDVDDVDLLARAEAGGVHEVTVDGE